MINVNYAGILYFPLYFLKPNDMLVRWVPKDYRLGKFQFLPLAGNIELMMEYLGRVHHLSKAENREQHHPLKLKEWDAFVKIISASYTTSSFESLVLTDGNLFGIDYQPEREEDKIVTRFRVPTPGRLFYRSPILNVEHRFIGAYEVCKDIPKAIDIAVRTCGFPGYEGNFVEFDLNKYFEIGVFDACIINKKQLKGL